MRVAHRAAEQYGVVSAAQLAADGLKRSAIQVRLRTGRLHPIHRGVYAVGHGAPSLEGRFMAATLACGPSSALGYRAGAVHWAFMAWDDTRLIEVLVTGRARRSRPELNIHRTRHLDPRDVTRHKGIRITTPARTLLDLADVLPVKGLRRAVRQAQSLRLTSVRQIAELLARSNGRRGAHRLAALIADGPAPTRSELEDIVLDAIAGAGLIRPEINVRLGRVYPDLRWPQQRLTLECDGGQWHSGGLAREDDADRQARLEARGERVLRVSWQQATTRPAQIVERLVAAGAPYTGAQP
ncbi:MAG: type IV toxin-antitoxin system AbiEi family antitoxin domain-containing protein [Solirubrobacteraceae bacterium]